LQKEKANRKHKEKIRKIANELKKQKQKKLQKLEAESHQSTTICQRAAQRKICNNHPAHQWERQQRQAR
jgi:hypothetical protein